MPTILVTGATGKQGGATVDALLAAQQTVRAYTRNASSPAALALAARGVTLYEGSYHDAGALQAATAGADGVFLNVTPHFDNFRGELDDGRAILAAARAAPSVQHVVYSTRVAMASTAHDHLFAPDSFMGHYHANKRALERDVAAGPWRRWTVLRPGSFMTNWLAPDADFMYPDLRRAGVLRTACDPNLDYYVVALPDIGRFAAAAFLQPEKFHARFVELASERLKLDEIVAALERVAGKKVRVLPHTEQTARENELIIGAQKIQNEAKYEVDLDEVRAWGVPLTGFEEFLRSRVEVVKASVGPHEG